MGLMGLNWAARKPPDLPKTLNQLLKGRICVIVKIMVPFGVPIIVQHLIFRVPKKGS